MTHNVNINTAIYWSIDEARRILVPRASGHRRPLFGVAFPAAIPSCPFTDLGLFKEDISAKTHGCRALPRRSLSLKRANADATQRGGLFHLDQVRNVHGEPPMRCGKKKSRRGVTSGRPFSPLPPVNPPRKPGGAVCDIW